MGITNAMKCIRRKWTNDVSVPHEYVHTAMNELRCLVVPDTAVFAHRYHRELQYTRTFRIPDLALFICSSVERMCEGNTDIIFSCDDYSLPPSHMKADTVTERNNRVIEEPFVIDPLDTHDPVMTEDQWKGLYSNRASRFGMYTDSMKRVIRFGRTAVSERWHEIIVEYKEPSHSFFRRIVAIDVERDVSVVPRTVDIIDFTDDDGVDTEIMSFNLMTCVKPHKDSMGVSLLPPSLNVQVSFRVLEGDAVARLGCFVRGDCEDPEEEVCVATSSLLNGNLVGGGGADTQWIPIVRNVGRHTVVVNVLSFGTCMDAEESPWAVVLNPRVAVDIFERRPCFSLKYNPPEADQAAVELAAQAALQGEYDLFIPVTIDSDWLVNMAWAQKAFTNLGYNMSIIVRYQPCGNPSLKPGPDDVFYDMSAMVSKGYANFMFLLLFGKHDYNNCIANIGDGTLHDAIDMWQDSKHLSPFQFNRAAPGEVIVHDHRIRKFLEDCLLVRSRVKKKIDLNIEAHLRGKTFEYWRDHAVYGLISAAAGLGHLATTV